MKRDLELIRKILLAVEDDQPQSIPDESSERIGYLDVTNVPARCAFLAFCVPPLPYYLAPQKRRGVFSSHSAAPRSTNQMGTFYKSSYHSVIRYRFLSEFIP